MKIDVHVHLAGVGTQGSGCWLSPRTRSRFAFRFLRRHFRVTDDELARSFDQDWVERVAALVRASELDRAVVLGFDGAYDRNGRLDEDRSQMIVPPAWVFEACRRHSDVLLPGPSLNPFRADAAERLEECLENGAALIKWIPAAQGIDPSAARLESFYRRLAEKRVPLLVHAGGAERTFREISPELKDVSRLRTPLEAGVSVICAHSGTPALLSRDPNQLALLRRMLEDFPNLWLDNSGMANPSRFPHLPRLARDPLFRERTLHGSDFPIPVSALYYVRRLGLRPAWHLDRVPNPLDRDVQLKRALGYPDSTLSRATAVLASLST